MDSPIFGGITRPPLIPPPKAISYADDHVRYIVDYKIRRMRTYLYELGT